MSIFEHNRTKIFNAAQHPLIHDISDFFYANERIPHVTRLNEAIDYIVSVLYPNYVSTVATPGDLPAIANPNDYYIVNDDGDGKSAGYIWSVIDNVGRFIKRYDVDWSLENVLAEAVNRTMPMYAHKWGLDDRDPDTDLLVTGMFAGQSLYGGASPNTNLTLSANSGDAPGAHTGFIQANDSVRPTIDSSFILGTSTERWLEIYSDAITVGDLLLTGDMITSGTGAISLVDDHLLTTGNITATDLIGLRALIDGFEIVGTTITHSGGVIDFVDNDLITSGVVDAGSGSTFGSLLLEDGLITDSTGAISFDDEDLSTTGTLSAGASTLLSADIGDLSLTGASISVTAPNTSLSLAANGSGVVAIGSSMTSGDQTITGTVAITGQLDVDTFHLDGNTLTTVAGSIDLLPATGIINLSGGILPVGAARDLGGPANAWQDLYISGSIVGATSITVPDLLTLRDASRRGNGTAAQSGDTLFWDGSKFVADHPDVEIDHGELFGLGDDDHSQYVLGLGRPGGQSVHGGTAASESLTLQSTSDATKGFVYTAQNFLPSVAASFSGSWSGLDLGSSANPFNDVYSKGEFRGFRFENFTYPTLPSASAANRGRTVYATDNNKLYVDTGGSWRVAGVSKFVTDVLWNPGDTTKDVTVTGLTDVSNAIIQLLDNANQFERIWCSLRATDATTVRITATSPLPAGSYRLVCME